MTGRDTRETKLTRREVLAETRNGLAVLALPSVCRFANPRQARAAGAPFRILNDPEGRTLETFGNLLLPGAGQAGIAHYVDDQLARENPSFILKYLDYQESYEEFYRQGLAAVERASLTRHGQRFENATLEQKLALVRELANGSLAGWSGPPAPLFYFAVRNDALDVYYGTSAGFEKLQIPYMPHIVPPQPW